MDQGVTRLDPRGADDEPVIEEFVRAAQGGDVEAFGRLFDLLHEPIYRYVFFGVRRACDAEDLTQVVFMKALVGLPRYEYRGIPFRGWLFRLARNAVVDFIRSRPQCSGLDETSESRDPGPGPETLALRNAAAAEVRAALATLGNEQREVVALRFFGGLSTRETALAMDRQEAAIRVLQFRALRRLRRELENRPLGVRGPVMLARAEVDAT